MVFSSMEKQVVKCPMCTKPCLNSWCSYCNHDDEIELDEDFWQHSEDEEE